MNLKACMIFIALTSIAMPAYADEADDLYHEGGALYDAGKYTESYPKLLKAWGLRKSPDIAGNLAQTEAKLGKFADAEQHLAYAIRTLPTSVPPEKRKAIQHAYDDMLSKIGTLRVRASVEGATIVVNDRKVGPVPLLDPVFVEPGHYVVTAELSGHEAKSVTLEVQAGSTQDVLIELHEKESIVIVPRARSKPVWPYVVTAGGAAVGLGLGIGFLVGAHSATSDLRNEVKTSHCATTAACNADPELSHSEKIRKTDTAVGAVSLAVGAASLVGLVIYAAVPAQKRSTSTTAITPLVGPSLGGLMVGGEF